MATVMQEIAIVRAVCYIQFQSSTPYIIQYNRTSSLEERKEVKASAVSVDNLYVYTFQGVSLQIYSHKYHSPEEIIYTLHVERYCT